MKGEKEHSALKICEHPDCQYGDTLQILDNFHKKSNRGTNIYWDKFCIKCRNRIRREKAYKNKSSTTNNPVPSESIKHKMIVPIINLPECSVSLSSTTDRQIYTSTNDKEIILTSYNKKNSDHALTTEEFNSAVRVIKNLSYWKQKQINANTLVDTLELERN